MTQNNEAIFFDTLMTHLMEGINIPKVQIERVIGPVLGMFCDKALSKLLNRNEIIPLCPEFPFRKGSISESGSNQSTNVDWLLYNYTMNELIFFELKTADTSFDTEQANIYLAVAEKIRNGSASFLLHDIEKVRSASAEYGKYAFLVQRISKVLPDYESVFAQCRNVRIIYLAPEVTKTAKNATFCSFQWLSFKDLPEDIDPDFIFNSEWRTLRHHLLQLDNLSRHFRNGQGNSGSNYKERVDFAAIIELCEREGNVVEIGYSGGVKALATAAPGELQARSYKWDVVEGGQGKKDPRNWIRGSTFLDIACG